MATAFRRNGSKDSVDRFARAEGILLDPVYTGKAAAALLAHVAEAPVPRRRRRGLYPHGRHARHIYSRITVGGLRSDPAEAPRHMNYTLNFGLIWPQLWRIEVGFLLSLALTAGAVVSGSAIGLAHGPAAAVPALGAPARHAVRRVLPQHPADPAGLPDVLRPADRGGHRRRPDHLVPGHAVCVRRRLLDGGVPRWPGRHPGQAWWMPAVPWDCRPPSCCC